MLYYIYKGVKITNLTLDRYSLNFKHPLSHGIIGITIKANRLKDVLHLIDIYNYCGVLK